MTKPKTLVPADLLQTVAAAKPAEAHGSPSKAGHALPKGGAVKVSTKPAKAVQSQTRTSNRGK